MSLNMRPVTRAITVLDTVSQDYVRLVTDEALQHELLGTTAKEVAEVTLGLLGIADRCINELARTHNTSRNQIIGQLGVQADIMDLLDNLDG